MDDSGDDDMGLLIRRSAAKHRAPAGLAQRVMSGMAASVAQPKRRRWWEGALMFTAGAATCALVAFTVLPSLASRHEADLGDTIADNHIQSLMASHLMDVVSTDKHTVKPWFAGKLDFSPPVNDLADAGFPLVGWSAGVPRPSAGGGAGVSQPPACDRPVCVAVGVFGRGRPSR